MDALFLESPHFIEQLKYLNSASQDHVVHAFLSLAKADSKQGHVVDVQSGLHEVLSIILERVAFFPMKPTVMEVRETFNCYIAIYLPSFLVHSLICCPPSRQSYLGLASRQKERADLPWRGPPLQRL